MKRLLTAVSAFLTLFAAAQKDRKKPDPAARFDAYISAAMPQWKVPGLSVVVVKNGRVVFTKGYGVAELGKPEPFTSSTVAVCASTTKAMTAVCMGMLVDEGKVRWDDKVSDVFPALKLKDPGVTAEITIKDLFTHNTGLGNGDLLWLLRYSNDSIIYRMRHLQPAYSLRSSFLYQNLMYLVAGKVIHQLSGKRWEEFIHERLFKPLGMQHTYALFAGVPASEKRMATHYLYPDSVVRVISYPPYEVGAAGGVWSTAEDISKWMLFMLDSTKIAGKPVLKSSTYANLLKPHVMGRPYPTAAVVKHHWDTYGLGWFQHDYKGRILQYHTGSLDGATAIIGLLPEENFGVYVFGNLDHAELRHALLYKAADLWCFNDDSNDWSRLFFPIYAEGGRQFRQQWASFDSSRVPGTRPTLAVKEYAGVYENEVYGTAELKLENDSLKIYVPGELVFEMSHWHYDTFKAQPQYNWWLPSIIQFSLNPSGKVEQLIFDGVVYKKK